ESTDRRVYRNGGGNHWGGIFDKEGLHHTIYSFVNRGDNEGECIAKCFTLHIRVIDGVQDG
ncbi:hypothetical protein POVCU2_0084930, partial [Plasmodium ovale curtisi]